MSWTIEFRSGAAGLLADGDARQTVLVRQGEAFRRKSRFRSRHAALCATLFIFFSNAGTSFAAILNGSPANYRALVRMLGPGDTLRLAPGRYPGLALENLHGTADAWITIAGPAPGEAAVVPATPNNDAVELVNCSYVSIEHLRIDSQRIPGAFGISASGHENNLVHDIRIEGNVLVGQNGSQQTDGISTKTPTWGWIIRGNQILGAGTGIYLGDSDGTQPFVAGIIENNLIRDTIGYNMEIKDQISLPAIPGMPLAATATIIRNNVFIKNDLPSPDGDRPNLLVGAFPGSGAGSTNSYEIYGNYFVHNHREALFQGSGRLSLHDNIFVDGPYTYPAVVLMNQNYPLKVAYVYNNTIFTTERGIYFGSPAQIDSAVVGNLVFALKPISGSIARQSDNMAEPVDKAGAYVKAPSFDLGRMDFSPLPGRCQGTPIDLRPFQTDADYGLDFNGTPKAESAGAVTFRGAYAGAGANAGWQLRAGLKKVPEALNRAATLVWVAPATVRAGSTAAVVLTGANFEADSTVEVSGEGITVDSVAVNSRTELNTVLTVAGDVTGGDHDIRVKTASGTSSSARFQVVARSQAGSGRGQK